MPQGKLFMDKQNLSLQRQKQSRSSWKEITWCSVNNSYGFSSSLMRGIQDNLELCRSYLSWECNHFISVCLKMRGKWTKEPIFPLNVKPPRPPGRKDLRSPHACACGKLTHMPSTWWVLSRALDFNTLVKWHFSNMTMKNVLSWK